jgi:transposase
MTTLVLELPDAFAKALSAKHPGGLEAAAAVALKAYLTGGRPVINKDRDAAIVRLILDGKRRADIAKEFDLSIVRINQIAAEHSLTQQRPSFQQRQLNAERDQAIVAQLRDGKRYAQVAATFNLSITRVSQLAAINGITNNRPSQVERQAKTKLAAEQEVVRQRLLREWSDD